MKHQVLPLVGGGCNRKPAGVQNSDISTPAVFPLSFGSHQIENASVSIAALIQLKCRKKNLVDALTKVSWPGRLQKIEKGKLIPKNSEPNGEVFLDGGHAYETGKTDLECCLEGINSNGIILCDDYNFGHLPDVKNAIDEFVKNNNLNCHILFHGRFARIEK